MIIDCHECKHFNTSECDDCLVKVVLTTKTQEPLVLDADEEEAIEALVQAGLAPVIRFQTKAG